MKSEKRKTKKILWKMKNLKTKMKNEKWKRMKKWKSKNKKRKTKKNEKREKNNLKNEKRKTKNEKRKMKSKKQRKANQFVSDWARAKVSKWVMNVNQWACNLVITSVIECVNDWYYQTIEWMSAWAKERGKYLVFSAKWNVLDFE